MAITVVGSVAFDYRRNTGRPQRTLPRRRSNLFLPLRQFFHRRARDRRRGRRLRPREQASSMPTRSTHAASNMPPARASSGKAPTSTISTKPRPINTELNVFAGFEPKIPAAYRDSQFLFLANIDPVLQRRVREAMPQAQTRSRRHHELLDQGPQPALLEVLKGLDMLLINDTETRMLTGSTAWSSRSRKMLEMGPRMLVVKHGEYGATPSLREATRVR